MIVKDNKKTEGELMSDLNYETVLAEAHQAGMAAGVAKVPTPKVVAQQKNMADDNSEIEKTWLVPSGVCGFAWVVTTEHGNGKFVKHLKASNGRCGNKCYYGGHYVTWVWEFGQSYEQKMAYAGAYTDVLAGYGLKVYADGRLD